MWPFGAAVHIRSIDTSLLILQQLIYDFPHINRRRHGGSPASISYMNKTLTHSRNRSFIVQWIFIGHSHLDIGHMRLFILRTIDLNCRLILWRCIPNDEQNPRIICSVRIYIEWKLYIFVWCTPLQWHHRINDRSMIIVWSILYYMAPSCVVVKVVHWKQQKKKQRCRNE